MIANASGLDAALDRYEITIATGLPTVIQATLHNHSSSPIFLTGVKVHLSEGVRGDVYNPAQLHERLLKKLDPGQSWDGPLAVVNANRRGPLMAKGSIVLTGGSTPDASESLVSLPLRMTINDPRRNLDGSYDRTALPVCDRPVDHCCDPAETNCYQSGNRCVYVAEGYDAQDVCLNHHAEKTYEYISDLRVSSDTDHIAYVASCRCLSGGNEILCQRTVVVDQVEQPRVDVATDLDLSPDGRHYAYMARQACVLRSGQEHCSGRQQPVFDGRRVDHLPDWYRRG